MSKCNHVPLSSRPQDLGGLAQTVRAEEPRHLPTLLSKDEVQRAIGCMPGTHQLMTNFLYGNGLQRNVRAPYLVSGSRCLHGSWVLSLIPA